MGNNDSPRCKIIPGPPGECRVLHWIEKISDSSDFAANVEVLDYSKDPSELNGQKSPDGVGKLQVKRGIEVGHIFQLCNIYSEKMKVSLKNEKGKEQDL